MRAVHGNFCHPISGVKTQNKVKCTYLVQTLSDAFQRITNWFFCGKIKFAGNSMITSCFPSKIEH